MICVCMADSEANPRTVSPISSRASDFLSSQPSVLFICAVSLELGLLYYCFPLDNTSELALLLLKETPGFIGESQAEAMHVLVIRKNADVEQGNQICEPVRLSATSEILT